MPFELKSATTAEVTSVTPRIERHGDEKVPAITLGIKITGPNTLLDMLSPGLRDVLYKAVEEQQIDLPDVEHTTPMLRTRACERIKMKMPPMEGWTLTVEHGLDEFSAITLHDCSVGKFQLDPMEGGSIEVSFKVGTSDVDERYMGELAMKLGSEVQITLVAPEPAADAIDGTAAAFGRDHPDALTGALFDDEAGRADTATRAFLGSGSDEGLALDLSEDGAGDDLPPASGEEAVNDYTGGTRQDDDSASFEAGVRQALDQAGASPKKARRRGNVGAME